MGEALGLYYDDVMVVMMELERVWDRFKLWVFRLILIFANKKAVPLLPHIL